MASGKVLIQQDKLFGNEGAATLDGELDSLNSLIAAMYEHEVLALSRLQSQHVDALKRRLQSLPYYINQAAFAMCRSDAPLLLDSQNATWIAAQVASPDSLINPKTLSQSWFSNLSPSYGLVLPVMAEFHGIVQVFLDSIDSVNLGEGKLRTNRFGWFNFADIPSQTLSASSPLLLKPSKKTFVSACAGHRWRGGKKINPARLSLRELLLSCSINWQNYTRPPGS